MRSALAWITSAVVASVSCGPTGAWPPTGSTRPPVAASAPPVSPLADVLDAYVSSFGRTWGDAYAFSGYVAVARDGQIVFGKAYGAADRERGISAGPDTRFRIGSTTKPFTAIGILQLEERGLLRIDDSIRKYLPELPPMADPVTIHHCLTHTSGLPSLPDDEAIVAETGQPHPVAEAFASYKGRPLVFPPGERFQYSNAGFAVLGAILERVSGQSYEAYMREHIFGPAGMVRTTTVSAQSGPDTAIGYNLEPHGDVVVAKPIGYVTFGSGAIWSTANDLVAFDRALSGTSLLSEASKQRMFTPERDAGGIVPVPSRYGLGWLVAHDAGHPVLYHPGGVDGFEASFARVPDARLTVVVLSNRFGDAAMVSEIARAAQDFVLTGKKPAPEEEAAAGPLDAAKVEALAGEYGVDGASRAAMRARFSPDVVEGWAGLSLTAEAGHLFVGWAERPGPEVFQGADGILLTKQGDLRITFDLDGAGLAHAVMLTPAHPDGRVTRRYERIGTTVDPAPVGSCPSGMVRLPGAAVPSFCMDVTEVTVGLYAACVRAGRCNPVPTTVDFDGMTDALRARWNPTCNGARKDRLDHPVNCIDWSLATAYCAAQSKRLPTAEEWEWAARGGNQERTYPWGYRAPGSQLCWSGVERRESTCPVGSFPDGDALAGIHDLAGNVSEWTSTTAPEGHVIMAGGWNITDPAAARGVTREPGIERFRGPSTGFRCVK